MAIGRAQREERRTVECATTHRTEIVTTITFSAIITIERIVYIPTTHPFPNIAAHIICPHPGDTTGFATHFGSLLARILRIDDIIGHKIITPGID